MRSRSEVPSEERGGLGTTGNYDAAAFERDEMGTALGAFSSMQVLTIRE
jgi:hypothetical protein